MMPTPVSYTHLDVYKRQGQESRKEVCIGFPVGNSTLDTAYGNNAARLSEAPLLDRNIFALSGGEKQRIACASAWAMGPKVFVLDLSLIHI